MPQGAYTGFTLAAAIQQATGRDCVYSVLTNSMTHVLQSADRPWLSDAAVAARTGQYPANASSDNVRSLNDVLGEGVNSGKTVNGRLFEWPHILSSTCAATGCGAKTTTARAARTTYCAACR